MASRLEEIIHKCLPFFYSYPIMLSGKDYVWWPIILVFVTYLHKQRKSLCWRLKSIPGGSVKNVISFRSSSNRRWIALHLPRHRVDVFSAISGHPVKENVKTEEVVEELPWPEELADVSPSPRLVTPLSGSVESLPKASILSHMWSSVYFQDTYRLYWKYSLFFMLLIILTRIHKPNGQLLNSFVFDCMHY